MFVILDIILRYSPLYLRNIIVIILQLSQSILHFFNVNFVKLEWERCHFFFFGWHFRLGNSWEAGVKAIAIFLSTVKYWKRRLWYFPFISFFKFKIILLNILKQAWFINSNLGAAKAYLPQPMFKGLGLRQIRTHDFLVVWLFNVHC